MYFNNNTTIKKKLIKCESMSSCTCCLNDEIRTYMEYKLSQLK